MTTQAHPGLSVSYKSCRLGFKADVIEPLNDEDTFRIETPVGVFQMTKLDFYRVFPNVVESTSYQRDRLYHYPTPPQRALKFRVDESVRQITCATLRTKQAKHQLPPVLEGKCSVADYNHWLKYKAAAHVRRDKKRNYTHANQKTYEHAIDNAVRAGGDKDAYTGNPLRWDLIRKYKNSESKAGKSVYKKTFADLPTVDHVGDGKCVTEFKICAWRLNDCKSDLALDEFIEVCRNVLTFQEHRDNAQ